MKNQIAFTLIELLIVIAIIGILAAIAVSSFMNARTRASIARVQADMKTTENALGFFMADQSIRKPAYDYVNTHKYPYEFLELTTPIPYMDQLPADVFKPTTAEEEWMLPNDPYIFYISDTPHNHEIEQEFMEEGYVIYGVYFLASYGPNRAMEYLLGSRSRPFVRCTLWDYDPSNGLLSSGDIIKFGNVLAS
jgi:prepilin-type N-terminal cleavage/methylation domain-containing protein